MFQSSAGIHVPVVLSGKNEGGTNDDHQQRQGLRVADAAAEMVEAERQVQHQHRNQRQKPGLCRQKEKPRARACACERVSV